MTQPDILTFRTKELREREAKVQALRRRFKRASIPAGRRSWRARLGRTALMAYWLICVAVIAGGLNALHPEFGRRVAFALRDPAMDLAAPFPNCAAAHAAGYSDIPIGSRAYTPSQDVDLDGLACEPYPHTSADERLSRVWQRWRDGG